MGNEGLEALKREESRMEKLLSDGKMSVVKQDELRYHVKKQRHSCELLLHKIFFNRRTMNILKAFDSGIAMEQRRDEL